MKTLEELLKIRIEIGEMIEDDIVEIDIDFVLELVESHIEAITK
jgi:hypothetical protein